MRIMPFDSFEIHINLTPEQVRHKLLFITKKFTYRRSADSYVLKGEIKTDSFAVMKCLSYHNSFQPMIYGYIRRDEDGTTIISVEQRLSKEVKYFCYVWLGFLVIFLSFSLIILLQGDPLFFVHCCFMGIGMLVLTHIGFWIEARNTKRFFERLFDKDL